MVYSVLILYFCTSGHTLHYTFVLLVIPHIIILLYLYFWLCKYYVSIAIQRADLKAVQKVDRNARRLT